LLTISAMAQSAPSRVTSAREPSVELQLKMMKLQRQKDSLFKQQKALSDRFTELQQKFFQSPEVKDLARQNDELKARQAEVDKTYQDEKTEFFKQVGLNEKDYDFDDDTLTAIPKAKPAQPTPSPEKK